jgi:AraC-like DNA-binding protein
MGAATGDPAIVHSADKASEKRLALLSAELAKRCSALAAAGQRLLALQERTQQICDGLRREVAESHRKVDTMVRSAGDSVGTAAAAWRRATTVPRGLPAARLRRVMAYIDDSLDEGLTVSTLAGVAGMSPSHFTTLFKRSTGVSPHEAVLCRRVVKARELLRDDIQSVAAIGCQLGFSSQSHFTTAFRKRTGLTPSAFRLDGARRGRARTAQEISANPAIRPRESESPQPADTP